MGTDLAQQNNFSTENKSMSGALGVSVLFHVLIIVVMTVGLPFVPHDPLVISTPISVEIVDVDELTQTSKQPVSTKQKENISRPAPAPKVDSVKPPDLTVPAPPDIDDEIVEPEEIVPPKPLEKIKITKPKVKPKLPPQKKPAPPVKEKNSFDSLLKNLIPDDPNAAEKEVEEELEDNAKPSQITPFSDRLTMSEEDALRRQLGQCWNVMSGAKFAENLIVEIRVVMNQDRTVRKATILHQGRYNQNAHYRAAADAALRALRNPRCKPLDLPPEKYEQWKTMTIKFDPREML